MKKTVVQNINVGVDTGKDYLDIDIRPFRENFRVSNGKVGISKAIKHLEKLNLQRVVIEAIGRYEAAFITACTKAGVVDQIIIPVPFVLGAPVD